jgi:spore germination protein YaaH
MQRLPVKFYWIGVVLLGLMPSGIFVQSCGPVDPGTTPTPTAPPTIPPAAPSPAAPAYLTLGFYTQYMGPDASFNSLQSFSSYINTISAAVFSVDATGAVNGSIANSQVVGFDKANAIRTYASVSNADSGGFNAKLGHSAITANKSIVIGNLVGLARNSGFDGIDLDFEGLDPRDRGAYSKFVHDLAGTLHTNRLKLILSVPAKQSDDPTNTWSGAIDYAAIGQDADLLQMMTYDEHIPGHGTPGPVSGSDWVAACIQYAIAVVAPSKLLIGLPAYGYDWKQKADGAWVAGNSNYLGVIPWTQNPTQTASWDAASNSPYVDYTDADGSKHEAWFENPQSIQVKVALVKQYHLAGISMWQMGDENLSFWQSVKAGLN